MKPKPKLLKRGGLWVCHTIDDLGKLTISVGKNPVQAYIGWLMKAYYA
jgi:hypothetical protein